MSCRHTSARVLTSRALAKPTRRVRSLNPARMGACNDTGTNDDDDDDDDDDEDDDDDDEEDEELELLAFAEADPGANPCPTAACGCSVSSRSQRRSRKQDSGGHSWNSICFVKRLGRPGLDAKRFAMSLVYPARITIILF